MHLTLRERHCYGLQIERGGSYFFKRGLLGIITFFLFLLFFLGGLGYTPLCFYFSILACFIFRLVRYSARVLGIHFLESSVVLWESIIFFCFLFSSFSSFKSGHFCFVHALICYGGYGYDYDMI